MSSSYVPFVAAATVLVLVGCSEETPERVAPKDPVVTVAAAIETAPMADNDDAADDPAIWVNHAAPQQSFVIGTNKRRGLVVFGLDGREVSKRDDGRMNNVDLRQDVTIGDFQGDLVAATNRTDKTIALYSFDGAQGTLSPVLSIPSGFADPYGLCMYRNPDSGAVYVIANNADDGAFAQWHITAEGTTFAAEQVRTFTLGTQAEGCAVDDENGALFIAEEDVGLYAYWADPAAATTNRNARLIIDSTTSGHLTADAEGVALLTTPDGGGYLIVSSQGSNSYNVYDRAAPHAFRGAFVIGPTAADKGIDGVEETDGIEVTSVNLGGVFEEGLFVAQDGFNYEGVTEDKKANQNFKLVPWGDIRAALQLPEPGTAAIEDEATEEEAGTENPEAPATETPN